MKSSNKFKVETISSKNLIKFGYAPGYYEHFIGCVDCHSVFIGDRRATRCRDCAEKCLQDCINSNSASYLSEQMLADELSAWELASDLDAEEFGF